MSDNLGKILHNKKDPYYISFICDECKKDPSKLTIAEESRFDLRDKIGREHLSVKNLTNQEITRIITNFMNNSTLLSIGDYCKQENISRHQFSQIINRYKQLYPEMDIETLINNKVKTIQKRKLKKIHNKGTIL